MLPYRRSILLFAVSSTAVFVALVAFWPALDHGYGWVFVGLGNGVTGVEGKRQVTYRAAPSDTHDVELHVVRKDLNLQRRVEISSRRHGYLPTIFAIALILSTPIRWRQRWVALLVGLALVHLYVAIKLALFPYAYEPFPQGQSAGWAQRALGHFLWVIAATSAGWMMPPLLIWVVICGPMLSRQLRGQANGDAEVKA